MFAVPVQDAAPAKGVDMVEKIAGQVVRFTVRRVVDTDEVHVAWAIGDPLGTHSECEVVVVQGLAHLTNEDVRYKRAENDGMASRSAEAAALLCAMHKIIVVDSRLPIKYKKKQARKPVCELPDGWSVEVDNQDVLDLLACKTDVTPIIPYGRFLWPAVDGDIHLVSYARYESIAALQHAKVIGAVVIEATRNQVAVVNSSFGPLIVTRHLVERYMQRLRNIPSASSAIANIAIRLASGALEDVTAVFSSHSEKWKTQYQGSKVYVQNDGHEILAHVVTKEREGDTIVTIYPLIDEDKARVLEYISKRARPHSNSSAISGQKCRSDS